MALSARFWHERDGLPPRDEIRFVLVGTTESGNIGAAARALKSMGFSRLVLVDPVRPWWTAHAVAMAHGAEEVLERAEVHPTLNDAVKDCTCVVATTRRTRRSQPKVITPRGWSEMLAGMKEDARIAIVFGPEKTGLTNEQIVRCHRIVTAPSPVDHPSLNLAQSVMVLSYESALALRQPPAESEGPILADDESLEEMYEHFDQALIKNELDGKRRKNLLKHLRLILQRAQLRRDDVNTFHTIARRISGWKPRPKTDPAGPAPEEVSK